MPARDSQGSCAGSRDDESNRLRTVSIRLQARFYGGSLRLRRWEMLCEFNAFVTNLGRLTMAPFVLLTRSDVGAPPILGGIYPEHSSRVLMVRYWRKRG